MYIDQHTLEKLGTARLVARYAPDYEEYLSDVFGREWRLAPPVEIKGTVRLLARFVPEKAASGEANGPVIQLWIEFNPAMGLYTVTGEFLRDDKVLYKSSPRMGFDDEMLGDPARIFDWLDQSVSMGESHEETPSLDGMLKALDGVKTPAGVVEASAAEEDGIMVVVLDPEGRRSHDDFIVSGTRFPNAGADALAAVVSKSDADWLRDYADPVLAAVQKTLDGLYGPDAFSAEMDVGGFVVVATMIPALKQEQKEPISWFAAELRRMAGVDGSERMSDRRLGSQLEAKGDYKKAVQKATDAQGKLNTLTNKRQKASDWRDFLSMSQDLSKKARRSAASEYEAHTAYKASVDRANKVKPSKKDGGAAYNDAWREADDAKAALDTAKTAHQKNASALKDAEDATASAWKAYEPHSNDSDVDDQKAFEKAQQDASSAWGDADSAKSARRSKAKDAKTALVKKLSKDSDVRDPEALAAWIGRRVGGEMSHEEVALAKTSLQSRMNNLIGR